MPQATIPHGTRWRYMKGCRCADCRAACARYAAEVRKRGNPPNHGTISGYNTYGCRCEDCKKARSDYGKRRKQDAQGNH